MITCDLEREATLPWVPKGLGDGEGVISKNGRYVALHTNTPPRKMLVVDMLPTDPQNCPVGSTPSANMCIGPEITLEDCGLGTCGVGHTHVSPDANYVIVKYSPGGDDYLRVYNLDKPTLTLTVRSSLPSVNCSTAPFEPDGQGYITRLGHEDMVINPFDGNKEYVVGQRRDNCGTSLAKIIKIRLEDGTASGVTPNGPTNEETVHHVSARAYNRPGWVYATEQNINPSRRFYDELLAIRLDGIVERFAHHRSVVDPNLYSDDDEAQGVPSPYGGAFLFRSNWLIGCTSGCGMQGIFNTYVVHATPPSGGGGGGGCQVRCYE